MNVVLDASAIVAYLNGEQGGNVVATLLLDPNVTCYAHSFNLCEVYYDAVRSASKATAQQIIRDLKSDGVIFRRDFSVAFWQAVGDLKAGGGMSLPDCVCVTLAKFLNAEAVTADRTEFSRAVSLGVCPVQFIR